MLIYKNATPINNDSMSLEFVSSLKSLSLIHSLVRSIALRFNPSNIKRYLNLNILKNLNKYDVIILFDCMGCHYIADTINKSDFTGRKVFYYWNPCKNKDKLPTPLCEWEIWTFDPEDSKKFGFKYGGQFIDERDFRSISTQTEEYDLYFCGINKGRFPSLLALKNAVGNNLRVKFRFVDPIRSLFSSKYFRPISYKKYLEEESKSKALVEFYQANQAGLTLRAVESLMLQKKLITNNSKLNKYSFFKTGNVLVSDNPSLDEIRSFLDKPFICYSESEIEPYKITNWAARILNNIEFSDFSY